MTDEVIRHDATPFGKALSTAEIDKRFGFHKASIEGPLSSTDKHKYLRRQFTMFAEMLSATLRDSSREASLSFTALEEASMWAHKAIAAKDELVEE